MKASQLKWHMENIINTIGDIDVRADVSWLNDTAVKEVIGVEVFEIITRPVEDMVIGTFMHENNKQCVVLQVGASAYSNKVTV